MSNTNEPSPASAGSHGEKCRCSLRTRLVGDGCEHCNPALMIDILREQIAEMRLTDEERGAIEWFVGFGADRPSKAVNITRTLMDRRRDGVAARTLLALLERLK